MHHNASPSGYHQPLGSPASSTSSAYPLHNGTTSSNVPTLQTHMDHPGLRGTPLAMLAAQCNKLTTKSPPPLADAAVGKGFHPWKKSPSQQQQLNSSTSSNNQNVQQSSSSPGGSVTSSQLSNNNNSNHQSVGGNGNQQLQHPQRSNS